MLSLKLLCYTNRCLSAKQTVLPKRKFLQEKERISRKELIHVHVECNAFKLI